MLRVVRTAALAATDPDAAALAEGAEWFMDYRNADGSVSEMCGNGVRVFALHLLQEGLVEAGTPIPVGSRDGIKVVTQAGGAPEDGLTVDMGAPRLVGRTEVSVDGRSWSARHVDMGNPHAVAFVDSLDDAGSLLEAPGHDAGSTPTASTSSSWCAAARGTSRCGCTSAARARRPPAAPAPAR